jgi:hypothetical protein
MIMTLSRAGALTLLLAIGSCGSARPENPAYFNSVTGLKLCDTAQVRNISTPESTQAGTGVVYVVALRMSPGCEEDFLRQVDHLKQQSRPDGYPTDDTWINVEDTGQELLVTYST